MNTIHKKWRQVIISLLLVFLVLFFYAPCLGSTVIPLNDRASDIIATSPLTGWDLLIPEGLDGKGQIVGIADSGLDKGSVSDIHPDLESEPGKMPKIVMLKPYTDRIIPDDPDGHGTHMAATIVGSGSASNGQYQGIAPGASLYFQALLDSNGKLKIPENLNTLFFPAYDAGIRIHVNGWGTINNTYGKTSAQVDKFVFSHPDFLPIFGAGNSGPGKGSLTSEANSKNALVVGSSQIPRPAFSMEARYADQVADSSSRGPTADGRIKPELMAPGSAVISACSSLITGNFKANEKYTRMGGTSMAAAVTGGAVAVVKEYLNQKMEMKNPSSALIKALLINGARPFAGGPSEKGFGILDTAGTILALEESSFIMVDNETIKDKDILEYKINIPDTRGAFKATLVWTDPPAESGTGNALINNLDLTVRDPGGNLIHGNDFNNQETPDSKNNTEQVYIENPQKGEYLIRVEAAEIDEKYGEQMFSLVYGQTLQQSAITAISNEKITLESGIQLDGNKLNIKGVIDGLKSSSFKELVVGNVVYLGAESGYCFGRTWETGGVQLLPTGEGNLVVEINPRVREGGYYLDSGIIDESSDIIVNREPLSSFYNFPAGSQIKAAVNPVLQNLWQVSALYDEVTGYIADVDQEEQTLTLLKDKNQYRLAPWAIGSYTNYLVDSSAEEAPFGYGESADFSKLRPGMKISLFLSPGTQVIHYLKVERQLVSGRVKSIDSAGGELLLDTGKTYHIYPGTGIYKDFNETSLEAIMPGDRVTGLLLPDSSELLDLNAYSQVNYGRIIYFNEKQKTLYLIDNNNRFRILTLSSDAEAYRWGTLVETGSVEIAKWARVICNPVNEEVTRIDIAEIDEETSKKFLYFDTNNRSIRMTDGTSYQYHPATLVTRDGYMIYPEDLIPGDQVTITVLSAGGRHNTFLAAVKAELQKDVQKPHLTVSVYDFNGVLIVKGYTTADRISLYREDEQRQVIIPDEGGNFSRMYKKLEDEQKIRVIAVDSLNGAVNGWETEIMAYPVPQENETFIDIKNTPAQEAIENLAAKGIVYGYEDGTFRPDQEITRLEFIMMITSYKNLEPELFGTQNYFTDSSEIPWWALGAVNAARENGIIEGYPDKSFRAYQAVSRTEMAVILDRAFGDPGISGGQLPYYDYQRIPLWGITSVSRGYERGFFETMLVDHFQPYNTVTRAQAAVILNQILD